MRGAEIFQRHVHVFLSQVQTDSQDSRPRFGRLDQSENQRAVLEILERRGPGRFGQRHAQIEPRNDKG
jgi:hypothetical protein